VLQAGATGGTGTTGSVIVKANGTDSTTAFALQNAAGTTVLNANTINGRISVGNVGTATGQLYVSGITPVLVGISLTTGGSPTAIYVQGHFAYETNVTTNTLKIYDVSNPAAPLAIGSVATGISPNFVFVQGRYAYVANYGADSMSIYDVSNPFAPTSVGSVVAAGTGPISIYVQGRYAYVANNISNTLGIYDISNPAAPLSTGSVSTGASSTPNSVYVQGKYAYVANQGTNALGIYDISNPAAPTSVGSVSTGASSNPTSVYVQGRYAYVANQTSNFLSIYDVKNPALPVSVGSITTGASSGPYSVYVQGRFAYVANYASSAISVYDVSSPATPASVASVTTIGTGPRSIYVQGRYAYLVTLTSAKMEVYDVGGTYTQQLEAGGIETGSLAIINSLAVGGSASFSGGINVSQSASINGNLSSAGNVLFQTRVNSTQAFQIQSTNATALLTADTTNTQVIVGNATVDATQINLQLDSSNVFADSGSCTTSANQGALYYNTASSEIRSCTAAGWSGIATVSGLGLVTYGVVENSGLNPGDLASTTTPGASGPCKVSWASTTTVSVAPCTAYSASRKVVVPSAVTLTLTTTIFSPYQTVCLNGTNGAPALSAIGASVSDPLIQPTFSTSAPIACLAVLQNNGSTAGVIGQIYDVRTFVSTVKEFATASTSIGPGMLAQVSGANIIPSNAATAGNQRGVVIASNGNTSSTTPNAIVAVGGSAFADAGTAGQIMRSGIVTGYAETQANFLNSNATFTGSSQYTWIGQSRTTFANTCTSAATCIGSLYFTLTIH
jgi:hypothetical protein